MKVRNPRRAANKLRAAKARKNGYKPAHVSKKASRYTASMPKRKSKKA